MVGEWRKRIPNNENKIRVIDAQQERCIKLVENETVEELQ